jgi:hypothetical protein
MGRRKASERNIRKLIKISDGKSYAIILPIETVRTFGWRDHEKLHLTIDAKRQRITVEALPRERQR